MNFRRDIWDTFTKLGISTANTIPALEPTYILQIENIYNSIYTRKWFYLDNVNQNYYRMRTNKTEPIKQEEEDLPHSKNNRSILKINNKYILNKLNSIKPNGLLMEIENVGGLNEREE
jgi:hypothetical protein